MKENSKQIETFQASVTKIEKFVRYLKELGKNLR